MLKTGLKAIGSIVKTVKSKNPMDVLKAGIDSVRVVEKIGKSKDKKTKPKKKTRMLEAKVKRYPN